MEIAYCYKEERANAATHAVGLAFTLVGAAVIVEAAIRQGGPWQIWGIVIYAVTMTATYAASTLSHVFHEPRARHALRVADQAVIYLFIVGSFSAVGFTWLREGLWWILHLAMWSVALTGFTYKAIFTHKVRVGTVSSALYLALGWMPVLMIWPLVQAMPLALSLWMAGGGLFYTFGIIFFYYDARFRYFHAIWHVMVIAGSVCHYLGILFYCTMPPA